MCVTTASGRLPVHGGCLREPISWDSAAFTANASQLPPSQASLYTSRVFSRAYTLVQYFSPQTMSGRGESVDPRHRPRQSTLRQRLLARSAVFSDTRGLLHVILPCLHRHLELLHIWPRLLIQPDHNARLELFSVAASHHRRTIRAQPPRLIIFRWAGLRRKRDRPKPAPSPRPALPCGARERLR